MPLILKSVHNYLPIKRIVHLILIIGINILFVGSYYYCNYRISGKWILSDEEFSQLDTRFWWILRCNIYAITLLIFGILCYLPKHRYSYFFMALLIGSSVSDVMDRTYFDINKLTKEDYYMMGVNILLSYILSAKVRRKLNRASSQAKLNRI